MPDTLGLNKCYTGIDFENAVVDFLRKIGFHAQRVKKNDGGVDITASIQCGTVKKEFCIQCKYYNQPLGKHPIQEINTGVDYYKLKGKVTPVVITNNRVTAEARVYAKEVGVEILADAEWKEIRTVIGTKKIINEHIGLLGIILAHIVRDKDYLRHSLGKTKEISRTKEQLKLEIINDFDAATIYVQEAARLQQEASKYQQKALKLQKEAFLRNLDYG